MSLFTIRGGFTGTVIASRVSLATVLTLLNLGGDDIRDELAALKTGDIWEACPGVRLGMKVRRIA